jgi:predicted permease
VRQLLTETLVLGFVGAGLGVLLATWLLEAFGSIRPEGLPADTAGVDLRVIAFAAALATLTGTGFGIYPALRATRLDLASVLKAQGRGNTDTRGRAVRGTLVVAQLALSIVLLIGAGLLLRSFIALHATESGVRTAGVLTAQVPLPQPAYAQAERQLTFYAQLLERVRALPGVEAAGAAFPLPFTGSGGATEVRREEDTDSAANTPRVSLNWATPGFFEAIGQPILSGRGFDESDREGSLRTVIINRTLARLLWPDSDPMGKRLRVGGGPDADYATVVGVVGDVRRRGLHLPPGPEAYLPLAQNAMPFMSLVLRVRGNPERIAPALRAETATLDPGLPLGDVSTVDQLIANSVADRRLRTVLLGSFAGLALLLAVVGVYGVLSYSVAQRSRELGIRMALGGTASGIIGLVLRDTAGMVVAGVVIGLLGALAVSRVLENLLYGVGTTDPVTFIVVPAVLVAAALIASWIPARRASRADPLVVLRAE